LPGRTSSTEHHDEAPSNVAISVSRRLSKKQAHERGVVVGGEVLVRVHAQHSGKAPLLRSVGCGGGLAVGAGARDNGGMKSVDPAGAAHGIDDHR
jgi:hypothetical protein